MPRHKYKKRQVEPDVIYHSFAVAKLINYLTQDGKKAASRKIVYNVLENIKKEGKDPLQTLEQALDNIAPKHEVKPRRLGGASYLVPTEVRKERRIFLALNWLITSASAKSNKEFKTFEKKLAAEINDALKNQGAAVTKKQQVEKLAEANKAFAHLKW